MMEIMWRRRTTRPEKKRKFRQDGQDEEMRREPRMDADRREWKWLTAEIAEVRREEMKIEGNRGRMIFCFLGYLCNYVFTSSYYLCYHENRGALREWTIDNG